MAIISKVDSNKSAQRNSTVLVSKGDSFVDLSQAVRHCLQTIHEFTGPDRHASPRVTLLHEAYLFGSCSRIIFSVRFVFGSRDILLVRLVFVRGYTVRKSRSKTTFCVKNILISTETLSFFVKTSICHLCTRKSSSNNKCCFFTKHLSYWNYIFC